MDAYDTIGQRNEKEVNMKRTTDNLAIARILGLACMALTRLSTFAPDFNFPQKNN